LLCDAPADAKLDSTEGLAKALDPLGESGWPTDGAGASVRGSAGELAPGIGAEGTDDEVGNDGALSVDGDALPGTTAVGDGAGVAVGSGSGASVPGGAGTAASRTPL